MLLKSAAAVLLALAAALAPSLADDAGESQQSAKEEQASGERLVDESDSKVLQKNKFIFGSLSTTTYTGVAVSTSTVFFSCLLGTAATVCQGRRRRLRKNVKFNASPPAVYESESSLDSSQGAAAKSREEEDPNNQEVEEKSRGSGWKACTSISRLG
ncbi:hypothetical protein C7M84_005573 [Penaeus vannamei]|uniref:Uncharacterized protein n=1 Tax=Penaeus vannamei TaxID=6689 RepID=A0A423THB0_PENVA|nr:hypothetical protein C7M84_005573 [Penaeus vannamei]